MKYLNNIGPSFKIFIDILIISIIFLVCHRCSDYIMNGPRGPQYDIFGYAITPIEELAGINLCEDSNGIFSKFPEDSIHLFYDNCYHINPTSEYFDIPFSRICVQFDRNNKVEFISLVFSGSRREVKQAMNKLQIQLFEKYCDNSKRLRYKPKNSKLYYMKGDGSEGNVLVIERYRTKTKGQFCFSLTLENERFWI